MSKYEIEKSIFFDSKLYTLARLDGVTIRLSQKEAEVLAVLCLYSGETVTRQFLFDNAWPNNSGNDGHLNRVILLLRRKFDSLGTKDTIKTIPKVGYILSHSTLCMNEGHDNVPLTERHQEFVLDDNQSIQSDTTIKSEEQVNLVSDNIDDINKIVGDNSEKHAFLGDEKYSPHFFSNKKIFSSRLHLLSIICFKNNKNVFYVVLLFISIFLFGYFASFLDLFSEYGEDESNVRFYETKSDVVENIYISSASSIDETLMYKAKKTLLNWKHDNNGKYYINISPIAISILHFSENDTVVSKRIFLNEGHDPLVFLDCALNSEFQTTSNVATNDDEFKKIHFNKVAAVKSFTTDIIAGCQSDSLLQSHLNIMKLAITIVFDRSNTSTAANKFFHSNVKITSYDGELVLDIGTSGMVSTKLISGRPYDIWDQKEKTVTFLDDGASSSLVGAITLMKDFIVSDGRFSSVKLDEDIYLIDIFGGVIISTR